MKGIKKGDIVGNEYILPWLYFWCTLKYLYLFPEKFYKNFWNRLKTIYTTCYITYLQNLPNKNLYNNNNNKKGYYTHYYIHSV